MADTNKAKVYASSLEIVVQSHPFKKGAQILHIRPVHNGQFASFTEAAKQLVKDVRSEGSYFTYNGAVKAYSAVFTPDLKLWCEQLAAAIEAKANTQPPQEAAPAASSKSVLPSIEL